MNPTEQILSNFEKISAVPRGSKHEEKIRAWLIAWAERRNFKSRVDAAGNLVMYIPATADKAGAPVMILQGHLDMVWQKTPDSTHDFLNDPIHLVRAGDWLKADRTTLGADNGIALALMLALAEDVNLSRPPMELLFTVEEETGLTGASQLDPTLLTGKTLINLDSETEGSLIIGCAGGSGVTLDFPLALEQIANAQAFFQLSAHGLAGGHSGGDINKNRANANKVLARVLDILQKESALRLISFRGGNVRNAIPREAEACFACAPDFAKLIQTKVLELEALLQTEYAQSEKELKLSLEIIVPQPAALSASDTRRFIKLLVALPNGVANMSAELQDSVETSNNIGVVEMQADCIRIASGHRSSVLSRLHELNDKVAALAELANVPYQRGGVYAPWQANLNSTLLKKITQVYIQRFNQQPRVEIIHGGLECGIISERCGGLETISLGPTIENPHSPDEQLYIPSLAKTWELLVAILKAF
ncbi:MAG: aminoacyl-histidine dipeptidase [Anaerolineales bacterium]|nr:aminoacyl-histidine dipeptidase [Anaerolineales bacterium]MCZ2123367.1 aminoacyl-histidine dipeptidase [Anaerolineales bacterium]